MERQEIHIQISAIIDKISYLNKNLSEEKTVHSVELDLLEVYAKELQELIRKLERQKSSFQEETISPDKNESIFKNEAKTEINSSVEEPMETAVEQINKVEEENKEHFGSDNIEETAPVDTSPNIYQPETQNNEVKNEDEMENKNDFEIEGNDAEILPTTENQSQSIISPDSFNTEENNEEENVSLNEKFKVRSFELADKLKYGDRRNLKDKIDINQRYIFIQELFEGDIENFKKSLRDLDECNSMEEAQNYIKTTIEEKYSWEDKQKHASRFIELVLNNFDEINNN